MLRDTLLHKALKPEMPVEADRSRCSRMRFDRSSCARCTEQCRAGALSFREEVGVDTEACSGCMLCTASCPSGCFEADLDFFSVLGRLRKIPQPVLGCSGRPGLASLNRALPLLPAEVRRKALEAYYYSLRLGENCTGCFACVGMCPSGALRVGTEGAVPVLEFKSSLCGGCGLCREFCMVSVLQVERVFPGDDPFLFGKTVAHTA